METLEAQTDVEPTIEDLRANTPVDPFDGKGPALDAKRALKMLEKMLENRVAEMNEWIAGVKALEDTSRVTLDRFDAQSAAILNMLWLNRGLGFDVVETLHDVVVADLVHQARLLHVEWSVIGHALGMTPQGAFKMHQRYVARQKDATARAASVKPVASEVD